MATNLKAKTSGLSDKVRSTARAGFVQPAIRSGKREFSIRVRDLLDTLVPAGFPAGHTPQVCSAIQTAKFLEENGLEIVDVDGPKSKVSTTVVVHYRIADGHPAAADRSTPPQEHSGVREEDAEARARRLASRLRGLLKDELAEYGGGEAFLKWVRSEDGEAA
jgi:hypothetical protein